MDFNEAYDDTNTSVGLTARIGHVKALKNLLRAGHPSNGHDNRGWRPLHEAAAGGHVECVRLLLLADDADVDAMTHERTTALHLACLSQPCHSKVVKLLLNAGADANMTQGDNWSLPLPKAVVNKNLETVRYLLAAGADPNREDHKFGLPLHVAAGKGLLEITQLLLESGADINKVDEFHRTALHVLTYHQNVTADALLVLDLLLEKNINVNARMQDGTTALMLAIQSNWKDAVFRLLEHGADVRIMKTVGVLALHFAIEFCPVDTELSSRDSDDSTAVLEKILSLTPRDLIIPETAELVKYSFFHLAVEWDRFKCLRTLIEAGVPPDKFLQESSDAALDEADVDLFRQVPLVLHLGTCVDTPLGFLLSKPLTRQRVDTAKLMIDKGSCVNAVNMLCLPPLVAAVKHQRISYGEGALGSEIVQYLLDHGADVMYKKRESNVLPVALYVSSLFNVVAFFRLLQQGAPAHQVFNRDTLEKLCEKYCSSSFYEVYPMFPWRVIAALHTLNLFVPQLTLDTRLLFDQGRMVEDDNLTTAWNNLDSIISTPKSLQQLCVLAVRRAVGDKRGWRRLPSSLNHLKYMDAPLPPIIMDLLNFRQIDTETLYHSPPLSAMPIYLSPKSPMDTDSSEDEELNNLLVPLQEESDAEEMETAEEHEDE
ncbi:ankyrin repeat and SOCS box protein 3-like isoform X2 [Homarus americanus]|uniref:ankyrin repeat and SOCS box protein 3-like isoform X2 n=1 Tax=Homarus americanus TaxID=6706 RepID=UPI001C493801|nr:ankyrin repeat and SOCS box protein 3-like isoform X2 [Homarus americanus]